MELDYQQTTTTPGPSVAAAVVQPTSPSFPTTTPGHTIGLIIPGRPARTDFAPVDHTNTKFALTLSSPGDLPSPLTLVNEIVCYLESPLPAGHGLSVYWQVNVQQQQSGFEWLGSLTPERPSEIFRTGWSEHDQFVAIPPQQPASVTIGISMEPIENIRNLSSASANNNANARRPMVAQKIARDLYNFMQSFDTGGMRNNNQQMVVPQNIFERWWKRFEAKSKRDPNFFLKAGD